MASVEMWNGSQEDRTTNLMDITVSPEDLLPSASTGIDPEAPTYFLCTS